MIYISEFAEFYKELKFFTFEQVQTIIKKFHSWRQEIEF